MALSGRKDPSEHPLIVYFLREIFHSLRSSMARAERMDTVGG